MPVNSFIYKIRFRIFSVRKCFSLMDLVLLLISVTAGLVCLILEELIRRFILSTPVGNITVKYFVSPWKIKSKCFQIKSDIDKLVIIIAQILTLNLAFGAVCRAIFGPLPYYAVVIIVEIGKIVLTVNLGILNASHIVHILIVFDFR